uniref:Exostosin GT47 domain-containing protein n=1 Tax=Oryza barthii TaxID=65489 RepID=A0A0D3EY41_9ORYZ
MRRWVLAIAILAAAACFFLGAQAQEVRQGHQTERISGSAGDVLEDDPVGRLKVYVYDLPSKYNKKLLKKDPRCLNHMFAAEIFMHRFLLSSAVRTFNPEEADWFYTPVYTTCDLTPSGLPLPFKSPRMMRSAIELIATNWPYWNRSEGADHFFVTPHDFGACFHYQEEKAIGRGILPLLQRATLVQTFGQKNHVCLKDGSITIPPYAPPQKMQAHLIPPDTPRSIFVYFRGLFYDTSNDPEGGYYARGARASVWENFKNNPLFDISTDHPPTYYEDMQRSVFCLCPLGWAPWSPRLVEAVVFGCIPVIIADDIVLPFADAIPWEEIGVFVAEEDVPKLDSILTSIPTDAMLFPQPAQPGDAFHQILNGLGRKLPHPKSVYLDPGQKVLNWTQGPVGDLKPWAKIASPSTLPKAAVPRRSDGPMADRREANGKHGTTVLLKTKLSEKWRSRASRRRMRAAHAEKGDGGRRIPRPGSSSHGMVCILTRSNHPGQAEAPPPPHMFEKCAREK